MLSQNNNGAAAPTPTPTPTPTPVPSNGTGDGQGTVTQATPTPTPTATPTATPTPVPGLTTNPAPGSSWPDYNYNWSVAESPSALPNVYFANYQGRLYEAVADDPTYMYYDSSEGWIPDDDHVSVSGSDYVVQIKLVRDGDLSSSCTVTIDYTENYDNGEFPYLVHYVTDAVFGPGESTAYMEVAINENYVYLNFKKVGQVHLEIASSSDYQIGDHYPEFDLYIPNIPG